MGWCLRLRAEIAGRAHESGAELIEPNSVHDYAGGQRILRAHNRLRQFEASAALLKRLRIAAEERGESPRHRFALPARIAAHEDTRIHWLRFLQQNMRARRGAGMQFRF